MTLVASINDLVQEVLTNVPDELRKEIRDWLSLADKGELTEVCQELLTEANAAWQAFDNAAKDVEKKLQD